MKLSFILLSTIAQAQDEAVVADVAAVDVATVADAAPVVISAPVEDVVLPDNCPNDDWVYDAEFDDCVPKEGTVTITCNPTDMVITFKTSHLFSNVAKIDSDFTDVSVGDCQMNVSDGSITIPYDGCSTSVGQADGKIAFTNSIVGDDRAVMIDGIVVGEKLSLGVTCEFDDTFTLTAGEIGVGPSDFNLGDQGNFGYFNTEFEMNSYVDALFQVESSQTEQVVFGEPVYNKVFVSGSIPANVDFVVKSCTAMDAMEDPAGTFDIIKDGCMDTLINTAEMTANLRGTGADHVGFQFDSFQFPDSNIVFLECSIALCVLDEYGMFQNPNCGFDQSALTERCTTQDDGKAWGYMPPSPIQ